MQIQTAPVVRPDVARNAVVFAGGYARSTRYASPRSYSQSTVPSRFRVV